MTKDGYLRDANNPKNYLELNSKCTDQGATTGLIIINIDLDHQNQPASALIVGSQEITANCWKI